VISALRSGRPWRPGLLRLVAAFAASYGERCSSAMDARSFGRGDQLGAGVAKGAVLASELTRHRRVRLSRRGVSPSPTTPSPVSVALLETPATGILSLRIAARGSWRTLAATPLRAGVERDAACGVTPRVARPRRVVSSFHYKQFLPTRPVSNPSASSDDGIRGEGAKMERVREMSETKARNSAQHAPAANRGVAPSALQEGML
jgi:hypothetical protein